MTEKENIILLVPIARQEFVLQKLCRQEAKIRQTLKSVDHIRFIWDFHYEELENFQEALPPPFFHYSPPLANSVGQMAAILRGVEAEDHAAAFAVCDFDHLLEPECVEKLAQAYDGSVTLVRGIRVRRKYSLIRSLMSSCVALVHSLTGTIGLRDIGSSLCVVHGELASQCSKISQVYPEIYLPLLLRHLAAACKEVELAFEGEYLSSYSWKALCKVFRSYWKTRRLLQMERIPLLRDPLE